MGSMEMAAAVLVGDPKYRLFGIESRVRPTP